MKAGVAHASLPPSSPPRSSGYRSDRPPRELVEREKERWGTGTARATERGLVDGKKEKAATKARGGRSGKARGKKNDRGAGPMILRWRMFNLDIPISADPGKDDWGVSDVVRTGSGTGAGGVTNNQQKYFK